jgi:hypothetical protein
MGLLAVAFAFGLIVGGASLATAARSGSAGWIWRGHTPPPRNNVDWGTRVDQRLHLGLTQSSKDSISSIAKRSMAAIDSIQRPLAPALDSVWLKLDSVWQRVAPAVADQRRTMRTQISALLSPLQKEKYDSMSKAEDEQREKAHDQARHGGPANMGGPGGPGPRGGFDRGPH